MTHNADLLKSFAVRKTQIFLYYILDVKGQLFSERKLSERSLLTISRALAVYSILKTKSTQFYQDNLNSRFVGLKATF
jgi:hypothetical protein